MSLSAKRERWDVKTFAISLRCGAVSFTTIANSLIAVLPMEPRSALDYRCEDGRFLVSTSSVTISNPRITFHL